MESRKRSLVKSVSWRMCALFLTFFAGWIVTGSVRTGAAIGLADFAIKIVTFYAHERLWLRVQWGRLRSDQTGNGAGV